MNGLFKQFINIVNARGEAIKSGLGVIIRTTAGAVATVYSNEYKASFTNPVTIAAFDALGTGVIEFWSASTVFDLEIFDAYGNRVYVRDWTPKQSVVVFDPTLANNDLVYANTSVSTEKASWTTAAAFDRSITLYGPELRAGDVIRVKALMRCMGVTSTPTFTTSLKVGGQEICTTGAVAMTAGDLVLIEADVTVDVAGASGYLSAMGMIHDLIGSTHADLKVVKLDSTMVDLSGNVAVEIFCACSASSSSNKARLEHLNVQVLKQRTAA